jgi:hypothetical protein
MESAFACPESLPLGLLRCDADRFTKILTSYRAHGDAERIALTVWIDCGRSGEEDPETGSPLYRRPSDWSCTPLRAEVDLRFPTHRNIRVLNLIEAESQLHGR